MGAEPSIYDRLREEARAQIQSRYDAELRATLDLIDATERQLGSLRPIPEPKPARHSKRGKAARVRRFESYRPIVGGRSLREAMEGALRVRGLWARTDELCDVLAVGQAVTIPQLTALQRSMPSVARGRPDVFLVRPDQSRKGGRGRHRVQIGLVEWVKGAKGSPSAKAVAQ